MGTNSTLHCTLPMRGTLRASKNEEKWRYPLHHHVKNLMMAKWYQGGCRTDKIAPEFWLCYCQQMRKTRERCYMWEQYTQIWARLAGDSASFEYLEHWYRRKTRKNWCMWGQCTRTWAQVVGHLITCNVAIGEKPGSISTCESNAHKLEPRWQVIWLFVTLLQVKN